MASDREAPSRDTTVIAIPIGSWYVKNSIVLGMHSSFLSLDQYSGEQGVQSAAPVRHGYKSVLPLDVTFIK